MSQLSKPVFKEDYLDFIREEKNGYWLVISKDHPEARELLLNKTSKEIIDYCDGTKTITEIISLMKSKYPLVPHEKLEKDINRTLAITSRLGLTKWIGENPFILDREEPIDEEYSIKIGNEEDLCSIYSFLKKSQVLFNQRNPLSDEYLYYKSKLIIPYEYEEVAIRQKLFSYTEEFILLTKGIDILGIIGIASPTPPLKSATIKLIVCPKPYLKILLNYSYFNLPVIMVREISKIRIFDNNSDLNTDILSILTENGFKKEAVLLSEFEHEKECVSYVKYYSSDMIKHSNEQRILSEQLA